MTIARLALVVALTAACAPAPLVVAPSASPDIRPAATPTPTPSPTPHPVAVAALDLLRARDEALRSGDPARVLALVADDAPAAFREREVALAEIRMRRLAVPDPVRTVVAVREHSTQVWEVEVGETDDQGRTRRVRHFVRTTGATRLTEPTLESLGVKNETAHADFVVRRHDIDERQCATTLAYARDALVLLAAKLGEPYRPGAPTIINCDPTVPVGLPAQASAFVRGGEIHMLTSASMVVPDEPGAAWSRTVVAHELAHVLLFMRGNGPFVLVEGLPLWLTNDTRQTELDRLIAADAVWDLDHLVSGPRDNAEFFAAYAQASSFVAYLAATYGDRAPVAVWEGDRRSPFAARFATAVGAPLADAYAGWRASLRR